KDNLESALQNNRRARAFSALEAMQASARERGLDRMTPEEIDELISSTRRQRRRAERTDA
ncbi:MAG: hypothetical protein PHT33_08850, partial [bacterium]|nr:hypothetical protein [bacterium]